MKDITVILIHYFDQAILHKALQSLKKLGPRLKYVIVFQEQSLNSEHKIDWLDQIHFISIDSNDLAETLNNTIHKLTSSYVLFLQDTDYLSPTINVEILQLPDSKAVLGTSYHNRNIDSRYRPSL